MSITLTLLESDKTIAKNINQAIADFINDKLDSQKNTLLSNAKKLIPNWIKKQPEIISLQSSDPSSLAGQFGISGGTSTIVDSIVASVVSATSVKFVPYSKNLKGGGLELQFQPSDFANLLSLPAGHTTIRNGDLHWLDWLLKRGDNIIVTNYEYNPQTGLGRSRLGNMIPGNAFRVPPQFSGTEDNNFITRAFIGQEQEKEISLIFQNILK